MVPGINSFVRLGADQAVAASTALVALGTGATAFSFTLPATKTVLIECSLPITLGATGGLKFQLVSSQTAVDYTASWEAIDGVTALPGAQFASVITATAAFASAFAVAGNHQVNLNASLKGHATLDSTITIQFACNSAANSITVLKGAYMKINFINA